MTSPDAKDLWSKACAHLRRILHPDVYSRWIAVIEPEQLEGDTLRLSVDNDFYQTWLEENYLPLIRNAIASVCGQELEIAFNVRPRPPQAQEPEPRPKKKAVREPMSSRSRSESPLNPKFIFDSFIVGQSNNFAHAASLAVAQSPARAYNPLFIYGDVGLGKTHLMQAIGHHVMSTSSATVCYVSSETFLNEYINALQNRALVHFRRRYRGTDVLLIDDIHFVGSKERLQEEFFHTFNALFDARKQIVMTSDCAAREILGIEQRLVSRFEWGLVTELQPPDFETRLAILRHNMTKYEASLPDEIITFLARNIRSNIRTLEGALIRTVSYRALSGRPLTEEILTDLLKDVIQQDHEDELTCEMVQRVVAQHFDIRIADMTSKRRPHSVALPRQVAMYLCRRMTRSSLPHIAMSFEKTHATVIHACKSIDTRMGLDPGLRRAVTEISSNLGKKLV